MTNQDKHEIQTHQDESLIQNLRLVIHWAVRILATSGIFMAVLIAIEIFVNISIYLREDIIHVKIVLATALIAIALKVIVLDVATVEAPYLWGIASIIFSLSIAYWLVIQLPRFNINNITGMAQLKNIGGLTSGQFNADN